MLEHVWQVFKTVEFSDESQNHLGPNGSVGFGVLKLTSCVQRE